MRTRIIDLNCKDKEYLFNMSRLTDKDWNDLAHSVVLAKGQNVKDLELNGYKVVIRDNKVKFKVFFQDGQYHEHEYHLDVFGRESRKYADIVSELFQSVMSRYYGKKYREALDERISMVNEHTV